MLRNSAGAIYITEGEDEDDFQEADKEEERVRKNLDVFSDQSIATDENDKKLLVPPLLGLYAMMLMTGKDEQRQLFGRDFFPKKVVIKNHLVDGARTPVPESEQKEEVLFGNLLERTIKMVESEEMQRKMMVSLSTAGATERHQTGGSPLSKQHSADWAGAEGQDSDEDQLLSTHVLQVSLQ